MQNKSAGDKKRTLNVALYQRQLNINVAKSLWPGLAGEAGGGGGGVGVGAGLGGQGRRGDYTNMTTTSFPLRIHRPHVPE